MNRLNVRWLAGLVIGSIVFSGLSVLLHEYQTWRNATAFLRQAKKAQAAERHEDAVAHLRHYIALAPNDTESLFTYGLALADIGRIPVAFLTLEKAIRRDPERDDVRRRLVQLSLALGRFSEAKDHLDYLLKKTPKDGELLEQLAVSWFGLSKYDEGAMALESTIANAPERLEPYVKLASLPKDKLQNPRDATELIDQMVSNNPENFRAYVYRGQWRMQQLNGLASSRNASRAAEQKDPDALQKAADDAAQALKLAPDEAEAIFLAAKIAFASGRIDDVLELVHHGIATHPGESRFYIVLAEAERSSGKLDAARDALQQGSRAVSDKKQLVDLNWNFANLLIDIESYAEATKVIAGLRSAGYTEPLIQYLEARIKFRRKELKDAIAQFERILPGLRNWPDLVKQADMWLGICYRETNSVDQQLAALRRAVDVDADWVPGKLALADALISANQVADAVVEYKQILAKPEAPVAARIGLARALLLINLRKPVDQQNWRDFDNEIENLKQVESLSGQVAVLRMEKSLAQKQPQTAVEIISDARRKTPDVIDLWGAQIALAQTENDWEQVNQILLEAEKQFGDTVALRVFKGKARVRQFAEKADAELRTLSEPAEGWTESQQLQLAGELAPLFLSINDFELTEKLASFVAKTEPNNLRIRLLLLDAALRANNPKRMDRALSEIKSIAGEGAIWHYGQAIRLILTDPKILDQQTALETIKHLKKAREERPKWGRVPALAADIYERRGESHLALEQYLEAIQLGETSPLITGRALMLLFNERRFDEGEKLYRRLHEFQVPFTDEMARAEISISLQMGKKAEAADAAKKLVEQSKQAQDPNWLGQVYATLEKYDLAKEQFRLATKANASDPRPWISLVRVLASSKQLDNAEKTVNEAKLAIAPEQALFAIGQCYEILGKLDSARESYKSALEKSPENPAANRNWIDFLLRSGSTPDAEVALGAFLEALSDDDATSRDNRQWAQRKLALVLSTRGSRQQFVKALTLIDKNLGEATKTSEDERAKAMILARSPVQSERKEAIKIIEKLLAREPTAATVTEDRFVLAGLYLMSGDRTRSRAELRKLIAARKDDPRFLVAYVQISLQAKETGEAELYFDRLQKLAPADFSTLDLQSHILFARARYNEIADLLRQIGTPTKGEQETSDAVMTKKLWAARRFDEFARLLTQEKKPDEAKKFATNAEVFYDQFVDKRPEEMLTVAEFLARNNQIDRALDLLQEHAANSVVGRIASVAIAAMKNVQATDSQLARLQELLISSAQSHDQSISLLLIAADLMSWRGDPRAAAAYKEVLRREPRNVAALNNFAVMLSQSGGDPVETMRLIKDAIDIGGPLDALLDTRGLAHLASGNPDKALEDFKQSLGESENVERLFHLAVAHAERNEFKLAQETIADAEKKGLSEKELHPSERKTLAKLREQLKVQFP